MGGNMRLACFASALVGLTMLAGCGRFEKYRVLDSGTGIFATEAVPSGGGAWTVCLADRPLETCPRSRAIFYGYRGREVDARWIDDNVS